MTLRKSYSKVVASLDRRQVSRATHRAGASLLCIVKVCCIEVRPKLELAHLQTRRHRLDLQCIDYSAPAQASLFAEAKELLEQLTGSICWSICRRRAHKTGLTGCLQEYMYTRVCAYMHTSFVRSLSVLSCLHVHIDAPSNAGSPFQLLPWEYFWVGRGDGPFPIICDIANICCNILSG